MNIRKLLSLSLLVLIAQLVACSNNDRQLEFERLASIPLPLSVNTTNLQNQSEPIRPLPEIASDSLHTPMVTLGRKLFHDTRLSGDGTLSCASCHAIDQGGDDNLKSATGIRGQKGPINTPTVLNSGFGFRQFWDGRAPTLDEQARGPVTADIEMGAVWSTVIDTLSNDENLLEEFKHAFGSSEITEDRIVHAIARFEETLITPSPFDRYLRGDQLAISDDAKAGYVRFKEYGCVSCHQGINVGGNLYQQFGVLNFVELDSFLNSRASPVIRERDEDVEMVKVPSLRNVALTAPYFHSGKIKDLPTAVLIMGLSQLGRTIPDEDINLIVAFLNSLTGNWQQHAALVD